MSLTFPDTRERVPIQARIPLELPGTIFRHKDTGQIVGVLSCDEHQWCQLVTPSAARYECSLRTILDNYSKLYRANLEVVSRMETDCSGEFPVDRRNYRVAQTALVYRLGAVRVEV